MTNEITRTVDLLGFRDKVPVVRSITGEAQAFAVAASSDGESFTVMRVLRTPAGAPLPAIVAVPFTVSSSTAHRNAENEWSHARPGSAMRLLAEAELSETDVRKWLTSVAGVRDDDTITDALRMFRDWCRKLADPFFGFPGNDDNVESVEEAAYHLNNPGY